MSLYCRVILTSDLDEIFQFETEKSKEVYPNEDERTLASWHARWRKESLEHYLPLGWSFLARDPDLKSSFSPEGALMGYFIAQPFLFVDGMTQTFWVEHISTSSLEARDQLCELAYKMSREKHFQKVIFPNQAGVSNSLSPFKPEAWAPSALALKTTKI